MFRNKLGAAAVLSVLLAAQSVLAAGVQVFSPQGEVARVRQARASFTESMVRLGDPRLPAPFDVRCAEPGSGRWVDDKTWVYDFRQDVPAGTRCSFDLKPGLKSVAGAAVTGTASFVFSTGGPAVVRAYPREGDYTRIEEEQVFALLLNGPATPASIERQGWCEAEGVGERLPLRSVTGADSDAIVQAVGLQAQRARVVTVRCGRPLPPGAAVSLVWGRGIATPSGVPNRDEQRLGFRVREPFTASFSCERQNAQADCLPIRPLRLEFSAPVPRKLAARVALVSPDGRRAPRLESQRGEASERLVEVERSGLRKLFAFLTGDDAAGGADPSDAPVTALSFAGPFPEAAELRIELPASLADDSGRKLANADAFPLKLRTADMPPLAKFAAAPFGVLELHAEPVLPVTVRHVEADLQVQGLPVAGAALRELRLTDDAAIVEWMARLRRYNEGSLPRAEVEAELGLRLAPPSPRPKRRVLRNGAVDAAAEDDQAWEDASRVQTRTLSLLKREQGARRLQLPKPDAQDPRPFEVIGLPLPEPGFYVVEIESPRLGAALLGRNAPMYVRSSALVTNLGVHFKHGVVNSGVWVTTLDKARPVADAQVQISDCLGHPVWKGRTDARGYAAVERELPRPNWQACERAGGDYERGYFVSARKADARGRVDLAFVWSNWNDGIEPWRFHVDTSGRYEAPATQLYHTVLDRSLLRAGQTVSMKHLARVQQLKGLALPRPAELPRRLRIVHEGSGQKYEQPLVWRAGRAAESTWVIPPEAKLGSYAVQLVHGDESEADAGEADDGEHASRGAVVEQTGSFRVEEFRLPVMTGRIVPPQPALVRPSEVELGLQIEYGNGGGASGLPVQVSAQMQPADVSAALRTERYPGFRFEPPRTPRDPNEREAWREEYVDEDDADWAEREAGDGSARLVANKLPVTLDRNGAGRVKLTALPDEPAPQQLLVQATYADPNGEIQTLSQTLPVWPAAVMLGLRTDSWVSVKQKLPVQAVALDTAGQPQAGVQVVVRAVAHRTQSTRKRLVGGFYAYDNRQSQEDLGEVCRGASDARGLVFCEVELGRAGEIELIAEARDAQGRVSRSASGVWVTRQGEVWFGAQNDDRIDLIPERRRYEPGETAVFQVRMPFRHATALLAVERNGILHTQVLQIDGRDPTVRLPVQADWGPNVYVSLLAVRGRIQEVPWYSFFTWGWRAPREWWRAWREEGRLFQAPTALVDLSKPAFKMGVAEIEVGIGAHELKVQVQPDKASYPIRATSQVRVQVQLPDGRPAPAGTEVALAVVDEALLELLPNPSWDLLAAMIRKRSYGVDTATAQMQIVGKRHYGRKAVAAGGGGGQFPTRELFDTLLLWNPRVTLDAQGRAVIPVPLNDALTRFRVVAVADTVAGGQAALFGTGRASFRSTQDLQIVSGLPPLVREGDRYHALFTLRNTTPRALDVTVKAQVGAPAAALPPQRLRLPPNSSQELRWEVEVPYNQAQQEWVVAAQAGPAAQPVADRIRIVQQVAEALPVSVLQATLRQLDAPLSLPVAAPQDAVRDATGRPRGDLSVALRPSLGDGLPGVRDYFERYPWGCLEQRASVAIGLRDVQAWQALMRRLPLYLDDDGLADYFPPQAGVRSQGSDTLTAYLLAISDEASRLGLDFSLPDDTRNRMEQGLIDFVQGRIQREFWVPAFLKNGDLDVRKLAALEALSRRGKAQAGMLASVQLRPNQWPTGAVLDWYLLLQRLPDLPERARHLAEAEQILRARLNVQGTRLGFSTERDDSWWWLMSHADLNSVRLILAVLDQPAWRDDLPRIVTGTLQRQQAGRWATTVANAWGSVATEAFARRFERVPVGGQTRAALAASAPAAEATSRSLNWAQTPRGGELSLPWPRQAGELNLTHDGPGQPWVTTTARAAVPLAAPLSAGYRITKTVTPVEQKVPGRWSRGDVLRVRLEVDAQADMTWVVVNDPIPAGATLLGSGLGRDAAIEAGSEREDRRGWLAYQERSFEAFRAYYRYLPKGPFSLEYTLRLNNPGQFGLPPTRVEAMYAPEMFGAFPNPPAVVQP